MAFAEYSPDSGGKNTLTLRHHSWLTDRGESLQPGEVKQAGARLPCAGMRVPGAGRTGEAGIAIPVMLPAVKSEG